MLLGGSSMTILSELDTSADRNLPRGRRRVATMRTPPARTTRGEVRTGRLACITLFVALCAFVPLDASQQSPVIRLAGSPAVRGAITEISLTFEAQTGVRVDAEYDVFAVIERRIDRGETFDIVVLSPELIHNLVMARTVVPETVSPRASRCRPRRSSRAGPSRHPDCGRADAHPSRRAVDWLLQRGHSRCTLPAGRGAASHFASGARCTPGL